MTPKIVSVQGVNTPAKVPNFCSGTGEAPVLLDLLLEEVFFELEPSVGVESVGKWSPHARVAN